MHSGGQVGAACTVPLPRQGCVGSEHAAHKQRLLERRCALAAAGVTKDGGGRRPVVAVDDVRPVLRVPLEVLERRAAEEAKAVRVVVAAVDAAHPEETVLGLEEDDGQVFDDAAGDADVAAAPLERRNVAHVVHLPVVDAVELGQDDLHTRVRTSFRAWCSPRACATHLLRSSSGLSCRAFAGAHACACPGDQSGTST